MKTPSNAQIKFAKSIARELRIELPKENTACAYFHFIHDNKEKFEKSRRQSAVEFYEENIPGDWFY